MNANFGIIEPLEKRVKGGKSAKNEALATRSLEIIDGIVSSLPAESTADIRKIER